MSESSLVERLRRPEHTGERRCWPCTVVNLAVLGVVALLVRRRSRGLALPVALLGVVGIWLRGYLVPGTPTFAPRLVAALPLPYDPFEHEAYVPDPSASGVAGPDGSARVGDGAAPGEGDRADDTGAAPDTSGSLGTDGAESGARLLERLLEVGVVVADGDDLTLDAEFDADWRDEMDELAGLDTESLAEATFEVAHAATQTTFENERGEWIVLGDGSGEFDGQTWLTRPVAVAETAAVRALEGWLDDHVTRQAAAGPLRMFLQSCPDCGTDLVESTTAACCGGGTDPRSEPDDVLSCPACRVRLYTFAE